MINQVNSFIKIRNHYNEVHELINGGGNLINKIIESSKIRIALLTKLIKSCENQVEI